MDWISIGREEEFRSGIHRRSTPEADILIVSLEGYFYAFDPVCPHGGGSLVRSEIEGSTVSCPLHGWTFDLSKRGSELHGFRGLRTYATRLKEGVLQVNFTPTIDEYAKSGA